MEIFNEIYQAISFLERIYWQYIGFVLIMILGVFLTIKSRGFQFKVMSNAKKVFSDLRKIDASKGGGAGTNPIKLLFTSVGGTVGLGNIATVTMVVTIGGPGGLFWMWLAAIFGMLIKYSEIYLGVTHRHKNRHGGYDGGPMYYLSKVFNRRVAALYSFLLCIYGVEVYQFFDDCG